MTSCTAKYSWENDYFYFDQFHVDKNNVYFNLQQFCVVLRFFKDVSIILRCTSLNAWTGRYEALQERAAERRKAH